MPSPRGPDDPAAESGRITDEGRRLRSVSDRLISEIGTIHALESRARELKIGSPEFEIVSAEITDHVRTVFRMSSEQESIGVEAQLQDGTINDVLPEEAV